LPVARALATLLETGARWTGQKQAPLLSQARIKFLGLNLDFSIDRARQKLGYEPVIGFDQAMTEATNWVLDQP
jgi:nucleoside-diphosphate-sugar epimerase